MDSIDEITDLIINCPKKTVKVIFKIKDGKVKDFKLDLDSLADVCHDDRFRSLELAYRGLNEKSFTDNVEK